MGPRTRRYRVNRNSYQVSRPQRERAGIVDVLAYPPELPSEEMQSGWRVSRPILLFHFLAISDLFNLEQGARETAGRDLVIGFVGSASGVVLSERADKLLIKLLQFLSAGYAKFDSSGMGRRWVIFDNWRSRAIERFGNAVGDVHQLFGHVRVASRVLRKSVIKLLNIAHLRVIQAQLARA